MHCVSALAILWIKELVSAGRLQSKGDGLGDRETVKIW